jgi:hypothetical protein
MLIKDFIEDPGEVLLMTYPRRWGKSINMDMIKQFLRIEVDENGHPLPKDNIENRKSFNGVEIKSEDGSKTKRENHKFFLGGEIYLGLEDGSTKQLDRLKIADHKDIIMNYQGQFPVIHVDFIGTKDDSYENVLDLVKEALQYSFLEHKYLLKSSKLRESEKLLFTKYIDENEYKKLHDDDVSEGLKKLSRLLSKHFGKRSYIIMDEYDAPINYSYINSIDEESKKVIELFRDINETTFKSNVYLEKGLITGVLSITDSLPNNLRKFSILDYKYFEHYGFTQQEVEYLLNRYEVPDTLAKDIKQWYNGYKLDEMTSYNPWSIVQCLTKFEEYKNKEDDPLTLKKDILQNYWVKSGSVSFLQDLLKSPVIKRNIERLVRGEPIRFNFEKEISSDHLKMMKEVMNLDSNKCVINEMVSDVLFSYLFHAGYLTAVSGGNGFILPNNEIKSEMQKLLVE